MGQTMGGTPDMDTSGRILHGEIGRDYTENLSHLMIARVNENQLAI